MRRHCLAAFFLIAIALLLAVLPAGANHLQRYDRNTGQIVSFSAEYATGGVTASNNSSLAYWSDNGVYLVSLSNGAATRISTDTPAGSLRMTDNYIAWKGKLMNLNTGAVRAIDPNAFLYGSYAAYGSGSSYTIENLDTGVKTNIAAANGINLVGLNGNVAVIKDGDVRTAVGFGSMIYYYYWDLHYSAYDITTGLKTAWTFNASTSGNIATGSSISFEVNDDWFFAIYSDPILRDQRPMWAGGTLSGTAIPKWPSSTPYPIYAPTKLQGSTFVYLDFSGYQMNALSLDTGNISTIYSAFPKQPSDIGLQLRGIEANDRYITWFDNRPVPEPSSIITLVGLLGASGILLRRRIS